MASHTSAIQGLRAASYELKRGAAEQNRILMRFVENMAPPRARWERPSWKIEPPAPAPVPPPSKPTLVVEKPVAEPVREIPEKQKAQFPPGCARNRQVTAAQAPSAQPERSRSRREIIVEARAAEREILKKVRRSAYQV
jgi:hypothetical protein